MPHFDIELARRCAFALWDEVPDSLCNHEIESACDCEYAYALYELLEEMGVEHGLALSGWYNVATATLEDTVRLANVNVSHIPCDNCESHKHLFQVDDWSNFQGCDSEPAIGPMYIDGREVQVCVDCRQKVPVLR